MLEPDGTIRADHFSTQKTAAEDIAAGEAVCVVPAAGVEAQVASPAVTNTAGTVTLNWAAQAFTTSADAKGIGRLRVYLSEIYGGGSGAAKISIRSSLAGSDLWSTTASWAGENWFEFTPNLACSASTTYYVVVTYNGSFDTEILWHTDTSDPIPGNIPYTSDDGSSWTAQSGYHHSLEVKELQHDEGEIALASAIENDARFKNFIGFAQEAITAGSAGRVRIMPLVGFLTGLTIASEYYLSDTHGAISASAGTNSKKVGVAVSATELVRYMDG